MKATRTVDGLVLEASDLGPRWKETWPNGFAVGGEQYFRDRAEYDNENELVAVVYRTNWQPGIHPDQRKILRVFND